jgi:RimJ/RimL family protein N-acetyltransferase
MRLMSIYNYPKDMRAEYTWRLLKERTPEQSISHRGMPTRAEHEAFIERRPYAVWYFICPDDDLDKIFGTIYLTSDREIGIAVFDKNRRQGVGIKAMKALMEIHEGPYYANINPKNKPSIKFFEQFGFKHIQNTYKL